MAAAVEKAYQAIREGIVSGDYAPGSHLTAQDLAAANGLSRTPVREAMRRLHSEGLISFIPHRGAFVTQMEERDIEKIYDLRTVLESFAAEAAAAEATDAQIAELDRLAQTMVDAVETRKDMDEIARLNNSFHKLIIAAAANPRLEVALASIVEAPLVLRTFLQYSLQELRRSAAQHVELVAAIRARDPAWAKSVMVSHILAGRNALLRRMATEPA
jgi:DNA-binding GntR family transcriptional regulator